MLLCQNICSMEEVEKRIESQHQDIYCAMCCSDKARILHHFSFLTADRENSKPASHEDAFYWEKLANNKSFAWVIITQGL